MDTIISCWQVKILASLFVTNKLFGVVRDRVFVLQSIRPHDQEFIVDWANRLHQAIEKRKGDKNDNR